MELQIPCPPACSFAQFVSQQLSEHCSVHRVVPLLQVGGVGGDGGVGGVHW